MNEQAAANGQFSTAVAWSYTIVAMTLVRAPPINFGVAKALTLRTKTSSEPAATPGRLSGRITSRKTCHELPPRLRTESSRSGSICWMTPDRVRTMNGISTSVSAMTVPVKLNMSCVRGSWNAASSVLATPLFASRIIHP